MHLNVHSAMIMWMLRKRWGWTSMIHSNLSFSSSSFSSNHNIYGESSLLFLLLHLNPFFFLHLLLFFIAANECEFNNKQKSTVIQHLMIVCCHAKWWTKIYSFHFLVHFLPILSNFFLSFYFFEWIFLRLLFFPKIEIIKAMLAICFAKVSNIFQ